MTGVRQNFVFLYLKPVIAEVATPSGPRSPEIAHLTGQGGRHQPKQ